MELTKQSGIEPPTADDSVEFSNFCASVIDVPFPNNQGQAKVLIAALEELILDNEAKKLTERSE